VPSPQQSAPLVEQLFRVAVSLEPSIEVTYHGQRLSSALLAGGVDTSSVTEHVDRIITHMAAWDGVAADAFQNYVKSFARAGTLQRELVVSLAITLEAQLEIRRRMLTDVWQIGQTTLTVLDVLDDWCMSKEGAVAALTIVGAIAAVAVTLAVGGPGAGATAAVGAVNIVTSLLGAPGPDKAEAQISGATVPPVIESMAAALTRVWLSIDEQQKTVRQCLEQLSAALDRNRRYLQPALPASVSALATADVPTLDAGMQFYDR